MGKKPVVAVTYENERYRRYSYFELGLPVVLWDIIPFLKLNGRGRFGDHFSVGDHFGVGIISGGVQDQSFRLIQELMISLVTDKTQLSKRRDSQKPLYVDIYTKKLKTLQSRRLLQGLIKQRETELSCDISTGQYQSSSCLF